MRSPTLIGSFIFGMSFFVEALAVFQLATVAELFGMEDLNDLTRFELIWIWLFGVIAGLGLGLGIGTSDAYSSEGTSDWTIIGGVAAAGVIGVSMWLLMSDTEPFGIASAFIAAVMAIFGLIFAIVSYGGERGY